MRLPSVLLLCAVTLGCGDDRDELVSDGRGQVELRLLQPAPVESDEGKTRWTLPDHDVAVSVQSLPLQDRLAVELTLDRTLEALETRFSEELEATFHSRPCGTVRLPARCFELSHPPPPGHRHPYVRRDILVGAKDHLLLVEVAGPRASAGEVRRQAELVRKTLRSRDG